MAKQKQVPEEVVEEPFDPNTQGTVKNLLGMEKEWTTIGYVFCGVAFVVACLWIFATPLVPTGKSVPKNQLPDVTFKATGLAFGTVVAHIMTGILCFMWMLVDIVHRKNRFSWLLPYLTCCAFGQHYIPMLFYFFLGRKRPR